MTVRVYDLQNGGYTGQDDRNHTMALMMKSAVSNAQSGIIPSDGTDFTVTAAGGMVIDISAGDLIVKDASGGAYVFHSDSTAAVTIGTAPSSGTRYDLIIARVFDNAAGDVAATGSITLPGSAGTDNVQTVTGDIEIVPGSAGGSPIPPALPNTRCVVLKIVAVGTNVTSINSGNLQNSQSTTSRIGFTVAAGGLLPCTTTTRPSTPADGQLIWETDTNQIHVYDLANTTWLLVYEDTGRTNITLTSPWTASAVTPTYRRANGRVFLEGGASGGTTTTQLGTLPVGFRPINAVTLPAVASGSPYAAAITITTGGVITAFFSEASPTITLDSLSFPVT